MKTKVFILTILTVLCTQAWGQKQTKSVKDSIWNAVNTWNNGIPNANLDTMDIEDVIDATAITDLIIGSQAVLIIEPTGVLHANNLEFKNGSMILVKPGGRIIVDGNLVNRNNSNNVVIDGELTVGGDLSNGNNGAISGTGTIEAETYSGECCIMGFDPDDIVDGHIISDSIDVGTLPVELAYFTSECYDGNCVELKWSTYTETNCDNYEIHKTYDFIEWEVVAIVPGAGNSNMMLEYSYIDCFSMKKEETAYYRLKQIDYDGKANEFFVGQDQCTVNTTGLEIVIFPNPLYSGQELNVVSPEGEKLQYRVFDIRGNECNQTTLSPGIYNIVVNDKVLKLTVY